MVSRTGNVTVLYAGDDSTARQATNGRLEACLDDCSVLSVAGTAATLERLDPEYVDCVVIGSEVADGDGLSLLEAIRSRFPSVPIIVFSSEAGERHVSEAFDAGATGFVHDDPETGRFELLANRIRRAVTARQVQQSRRDCEQFLSTIDRNMPGFVYRCENEPGWQMLQLSDGVEAVTGYEPDRFLSGDIPFGDLYVPEDRDAVWNDVQAAVTAGEPYENLYRIETKSGSICHLWERGRAMDGDTFEALEGIALDVTTWTETFDCDEQGADSA